MLFVACKYAKLEVRIMGSVGQTFGLREEKVSMLGIFTPYLGLEEMDHIVDYKTKLI